MSQKKNSLLSEVLTAVVSLLSPRASRPTRRSPGTHSSSGGRSARESPAFRAASQSHTDESPGQFGSGATSELDVAEIRGITPSYNPDPDGDPDPGEVVWTWVPYAENDGRGKDRPVLIIARLGSHATAGCYLSTKAHPGYISVGTGGWDSKGRESFLNPDRILRISHEGMRREGNTVPHKTFSRVITQIGSQHGLSW